MFFPKIKDRLFATFLLLCLFPILFICFLFYEEAQEAVFEQYKTSIEGHLKLADVRLSLFFRMIQGEVEELAEHPLLTGDERNIDPLRPLFLQFVRTHAAVGNIHLLRDDFSIASLHPEKGWDGNVRMTMFDREAIDLSGNRVWLLSRKDGQSNPNSIYITQRVMGKDEKPIALLLVEIRLDRLASWVRTRVTPQQNEMMVVSPTGKIIIHTGGQGLGKNVHELPEYESISRTLKDETDNNRLVSFRKEGQIVYAYHWVSDASGNAYFEWIEGKGITERLDRLKLVLLLTICFVVGFSAYVAQRLSRWIGNPIQTLVSATESLLKGDFSIRVPIEGMREITLLESKFNQMAGQMQTLIAREREYMQESLDQIVRSFYLAVEMKDPYTAGHTERVTEYALILYDHLDENLRKQVSRDDLRYASFMHDIGKVAIPDHVLLKTGKLTAEEYEQMKRHSSIGANIVEQIESLAHVSPGVRHHHERWDGKGYPDRLKGEEIPLLGRIIAVADTFDAMTTTRSYRRAMTFPEAYDEIVRCSGKQFDPSVVTAFRQAYHSGSLQVSGKLRSSAAALETAASAAEERQ